jgi:hypothetical protein
MAENQTTEITINTSTFAPVIPEGDEKQQQTQENNPVVPNPLFNPNPNPVPNPVSNPNPKNFKFKKDEEKGKNNVPVIYNVMKPELFSSDTKLDNCRLNQRITGNIITCTTSDIVEFFKNSGRLYGFPELYFADEIVGEGKIPRMFIMFPLVAPYVTTGAAPIIDGLNIIKYYGGGDYKKNQSYTISEGLKAYLKLFLKSDVINDTYKNNRQRRVGYIELDSAKLLGILFDSNPSMKVAIFEAEKTTSGIQYSISRVLKDKAVKNNKNKQSNEYEMDVIAKSVFKK